MFQLIDSCYIHFVDINECSDGISDNYHHNANYDGLIRIRQVHLKKSVKNHVLFPETYRYFGIPTRKYACQLAYDYDFF